MDQIILSQKAKKWLESSRYLKEQKDAMSVEEQTAFEFLAEAWRTRKYDSELATEAAEMIAILVDSDIFHGSNRNIITHSKELRGTAKLMYTNGEATYEEMRAALRKAFGEAKPEPRPRPVPQPKPRPQPKPQPQPQGAEFVVEQITFDNSDYNGHVINTGYLPVNTCFVLPTVKFRCTKNLGTITVRYRIYEPSGKLMLASCSPAGFTLETKLDTGGSLSGTTTIPGYGSNTGSVYAPGTYRFELAYGSKIVFSTSFTIDKRPYPDTSGRDGVLVLDEVTLVNVNNDATVIPGEYLPVNTKYVAPVIKYTCNGYVGQQTLYYKIFDPYGKVMTGSCSVNGYTNSINANFGGPCSGTITGSGFGNEEGNCYSKGTYRFVLYLNNRVVWEDTFVIGAPKSTPRRTPNPSPRPTPRRTTAPKKSGFPVGKVIVSVVAVLILVLCYAWYNDYKAGERADVMYAKGNVQLYDSDMKTSRGTAPAWSALKVYEIENGRAKVRTGTFSSAYADASLLINERKFDELNEAISGNPMLDTPDVRNIVREYLLGLDSMAGTWRIRNIPDILTPNSVVRVSRLSGAPGNETLAFVAENAEANKSRVAVFDLYATGHILTMCQDITPGLLISGIRYDKKAGNYVVYYKSGDKVVASADSEPSSSMPFIITDFSLVNQNYNGALISSRLTRGTQYACPKIRYKSIAGAYSALLYVKVYAPDGTLERGDESPSDATYTYRLDPSERGKQITIAGWGRRDGTKWIRDGYRFEIWRNDKMLSSRTVRL